MEESSKFREDVMGKIQAQNSSHENNINHELNKEDKVLFDTKLTVRDAALKNWAINLMEEQHNEWTRLFEAKLGESEKKMLLTQKPGKKS